VPDTAATDRMFTDEELDPRSIEDVIARTTFAEKLRSCPALLGQPFHRLPMDTQRAIVFQRLRQMVNTMRLNPLWRDRLAAAGFTQAPRTWNEWQAIPITDRDTLNRFFMGKREGLAVPMTRGGFQVIASGGTSSGLPTETVYSQRELHDTYALAGQFMGEFVFPNFLPRDEVTWLITTLSDHEMWSSGTMLGGVFQRTPGVNFIAAGPMSENVYHHIMSFEGPKAIMGMSRELEELIPLGRTMPLASRESFKLAMYGSGIIQKKKLEELKALYPNAAVTSYFASNQAEAIGMQLTPDGHLTAVPGLHLIEIVDANGKWVEVGEEGDLVITRLHATEAPILRMELGDRMIRREDFVTGELVAERFDFAGRSSDILHVGESHFPARVVYARLCALLTEAGLPDIDAEAHAVQFQNDRSERVLHLAAVVDKPEAWTHRLAAVPPERIRAGFIAALQHGLPFFDRDEAHLKALETTAYRFGLRFEGEGSPAIHRTRVGKVPLIKDFL
jgi:phenylacetate-CoA ligase